jgi:hypothetical protein
MRIERVIRKRIQARGAGAALDADVNAVVAVNVHRPASTARAETPDEGRKHDDRRVPQADA